jgi:hypothetical protein
MTPTSDPSPPGETEDDPNAERWVCACSVEGEPGHHHVKLCRGHQEIVDRSVADLRANLSQAREALRPFADAYRDGEVKLSEFLEFCRQGHFARAAELVPPNT